MTTRTRTNKHTRSWLKLTCLIDTVHQTEVLQQSLQQIISTMGHKKILYFIASAATNDERNSISTLIAKTKQEWQLQQLSQISIVDDDNINQPIEPTDFSSLSDDLISAVCGYLSIAEITNFKLSSKQIGIVCLEEQTKINVALSVFTHGSLIRSTFRFYSHIRLFRLCEVLDINYKIPEQNQLIFLDSRFRIQIIYRRLRDALNITDTSLRMEKISNLKQNNRALSFTVLDKTQIVIINRNKVQQIDINRQTMHKFNDYKLKNLEYCTYSHAGYRTILLCKDMTHIEILNFYPHISQTHISKELLVQLQEMHSDPKENKLRILTKRNNYSSCGLFNYNSWIKFGINSRHCCMSQKVGIELKYNRSLSHFHSMFGLFFDGQDTFMDIRETLNELFEDGIYFEVKKCGFTGLVREKLADVLGNIVPANNIELYKRKKKKKRDKTSQRWNWYDTFGCESAYFSGRSVRFELVEFDTKCFDPI